MKAAKALFHMLQDLAGATEGFSGEDIDRVIHEVSVCSLHYLVESKYFKAVSFDRMP